MKRQQQTQIVLFLFLFQNAQKHFIINLKICLNYYFHCFLICVYFVFVQQFKKIRDFVLFIIFVCLLLLLLLCSVCVSMLFIHLEILFWCCRI